MKTLQKSILVLLLIFTNLIANEKDDLKEYFNTKLTTIFSIVKDSTLDDKKKTKLLKQNLDDIVAFDLIGRLSIGKYFKKFSKEEKEQFFKINKQKIENSFISKLKNYKDQQVKIDNIKYLKSNIIEIQTSIIDKKDTVKVDYKFYKPKHQIKNKYRWVMFDIKVAGVSQLESYSADYKEALLSQNIQQFLQSLNAKTNL